MRHTLVLSEHKTGLSEVLASRQQGQVDLRNRLQEFDRFQSDCDVVERQPGCTLDLGVEPKLTRELDDLIVSTVTPEDSEVFRMRSRDLQSRK